MSEQMKTTVSTDDGKTLNELLAARCSDETPRKRLDNLFTFYEYYNKCVQERIGEFDKIREQLEQIIEELVAKGKIGRNVQILSRIKAPESVLKKMLLTKKRQSDEKKETDMSEGTNDIYGVSILCDTSEEIEIIKTALQEKGVKIEGERIRKEKRGYSAKHFNFCIEGLEKLKVEGHMQTFKEERQTYPHLYYKVFKEKKGFKEKYGGKIEGVRLKIEEQRAVKKEIQRQYKSGKLSGFELSNGRRARVTRMWEATIGDNGKFFRRELSEDEAIRLAFYPALKGVEKIGNLRKDQEEDR